ncbi:MAG: hypothetical protein L3K08_05860, partial [Thermoplasmata archaeon]|nr:hypothetical protein [Thermoplasmata archaeon]
RRFTHQEDKKAVPFMPTIFLYITKWALCYIGLLIGIAALWPWDLPTYVGNLAATQSVTEPDWYFLWTFKVVDFGGVTPVIAVAITNVIILYVLLLPFLDRSKRTHPRDRPVFLIIGNFMLGFFILTSVWGGLTPGQQIDPMTVALRLVPIAVVNIVVVLAFYWRYQRGYRARLAAAGKSGLPAGIYPVPTGAAPSASARTAEVPRG